MVYYIPYLYYSEGSDINEINILDNSHRRCLYHVFGLVSCVLCNSTGKNFQSSCKKLYFTQTSGNYLIKTIKKKKSVKLIYKNLKGIIINKERKKLIVKKKQRIRMN